MDCFHEYTKCTKQKDMRPGPSIDRLVKRRICQRKPDRQPRLLTHTQADTGLHAHRFTLPHSQGNLLTQK